MSKELVAFGKRWLKAEPAEVWKPSEGDTLVGKFVGIEQRSGTYGPYQAVIVLRDDDNARVTITGVTIVTLAVHQGLNSGDPVLIVYLGRFQAGDSEYSYKAFELYVEAKEVVEEETPKPRRRTTRKVTKRKTYAKSRS
jgi:hypothetical protein